MTGDLILDSIILVAGVLICTFLIGKPIILIKQRKCHHTNLSLIDEETLYTRDLNPIVYKNFECIKCGKIFKEVRDE